MQIVITQVRGDVAGGVAVETTRSRQWPWMMPRFSALGAMSEVGAWISALLHADRDQVAVTSADADGLSRVD